MWGEWLGCTMKGRKRDAHEHYNESYKKGKPFCEQTQLWDYIVIERKYDSLSLFVILETKPQN